MNGLPYYKAYPRDFIEGTIGMPFEMKAAYRLVLDLIYMQGGALPDEPRYIAGLLGCSVKKWKSLRQALIEAGKIEVRGGYLGNNRADKELETLGKFQDKQRENRSRPNKNNGLKSPSFDHTEPEPDTEVREEPKGSLSESSDDPVSRAVEIYNFAAPDNGWPVVQKITKARRSALNARLKDVGGIDGWQAAIAKASASDFLCGRSARGSPFFASFDFLTRQSSFVKLMEGQYDNRTHCSGQSQMAGGTHSGGSGQGASIASIAARRRFARQA